MLHVLRCNEPYFSYITKFYKKNILILNNMDVVYIDRIIMQKMYFLWKTFKHSFFCYSSSRTHSRITRYPCGPRQCYQPYMYHILQSWATGVCFLVQRWIGKYIKPIQYLFIVIELNYITRCSIYRTIVYYGKIHSIFLCM